MQQRLLILGNNILYQALKNSESNNKNLEIHFIRTHDTLDKKSIYNYIVKHHIDYLYPTSINWRDFIDETFLKAHDVKILAANQDALAIEKDRFFAKTLCDTYNVPFVDSYVFTNQNKALNFIKKNPAAYVIKNKYSSPISKIKTTVCISYEQTLSLLKQTDCSDGVFLQKYAGDNEAGHTVFINHGNIYALCTNQEYKKLYTGNLGETLSTPMGGLIEIDQSDRYKLVSQLIEPLKPWFKKVNYCGPLQVTAIKNNKLWQVLEYNTRLGVSSGPMIMLSIDNFFNTFKNMYLNQAFDIKITPNKTYSCLLHIVSHQYPNKNQQFHYPIQKTIHPDCAYFWEDIVQKTDSMHAQQGHSIVNIVTSDNNLNHCLDKIYNYAKDIQSYGSFYRTDIGKTLWPIR